jgi:hypothetical protein
MRGVVVFVALLAAGCGLVSGLDSLSVDGGDTDASAASDVIGSPDADGIDVQTSDVVIQPDSGRSLTALSSVQACSTIAGATTLSLTGSEFTIEMWLQVNALVQGQLEIDPILWKGGRTTAEPGWTLALSAGGLVFCVADTGAQTCSTAFQPPVGDLVHVAVISTTGTVRTIQIFQRDVTKQEPLHVMRAQLNNTLNDWGTTSTFTVGGVMGSTQCTTAPKFVVDDLRVYNIAIGQSQLDADMGTIACNTPGLIAYFKFDEGSGITANDCSNSKLSLSLGKGASFVTSPFP